MMSVEQSFNYHIYPYLLLYYLALTTTLPAWGCVQGARAGGKGRVQSGAMDQQQAAARPALGTAVRAAHGGRLAVWTVRGPTARRTGPAASDGARGWWRAEGGEARYAGRMGTAGRAAHGPMTKQGVARRAENRGEGVPV